MPTCEFAVRLRAAPLLIRVAVEENTNPSGVGCDLLDDSLRPDAARGFPTMTATLETDVRGYAAACGWVQLVRSTDGADPAAFEPDPLALFADAATPYAFFGIAPAFFDAPFRSTRDDLTWRAHTFLCLSPDAVMSTRVDLVAGFSWGFRLEAGHVTIEGPEPLAPAVWDDHRPVLSARYPRWDFRPASA